MSILLELKTLENLETVGKLLLKGAVDWVCLVECEIDKYMIFHCRFLTTIYQNFHILLLTFLNHWRSLQSDWLSSVQFTRKSHHFVL